MEIDIDKIKECREKGLKLREISKMFNCSIYKVHRILNPGKYREYYNPKGESRLAIAQGEYDEPFFTYEQDLKIQLIKKLDEIEEGLKLYPDGEEFNTEIGRIDILATDKNNNFVVIELKVGIADDRALGQIQGYMAWVKENIAENEKVRGIIISNSITPRLRYAIQTLTNLEAKRYELHFSFLCHEQKILNDKEITESTNGGETQQSEF